MIILFLSIVPILVFSFWIYSKNRYNKEPLRILIKYFTLGVFISFIAIILEGVLSNVNIFKESYFLVYTSFIIAGLTEEVLKAIVLIPSSIREKTFDEKLDGIMYSVFLSLGFATIENIFYIKLEQNLSQIEIALSRTLISIPAHIMFAITMGYYISKYKFEKDKFKKREYLILSILIPVLLHGIFDFILMIGYRWAIIVFIAYLVIIGKNNLDKLDKYMGYSKKRFFKRKNKR